MRLLLTRSPSDVERRIIRLAGIRESGILRDFRGDGTPIQIVFRGNAPPEVTLGVTTSEARADVKWYWHDGWTQCVDPCPIYIEGHCWCQHLDPIIVEGE